MQPKNFINVGKFSNAGRGSLRYIIPRINPVIPILGFRAAWLYLEAVCHPARSESCQKCKRGHGSYGDHLLEIAFQDRERVHGPGDAEEACDQYLLVPGQCQQDRGILLLPGLWQAARLQ